MNYFEKHIGDYLKDTSHLSLLEHGVYNRLLDVYYTRESGIPDGQVARLIGARSRDEKEALRSVLDEFFQQVDGVWKQLRCDAEIARYHETEPEREARRENDRERQRRSRERRKTLFEALRELDIVPPFDTKTSELEALLSRTTSQHVTRDTSHHVTRDTSHHVTRDNTATHTHTHTHTQSHTSEPKVPRGRGSRLPADWDPGEAGFAFAAQQGLTNGRAQAELDRFRDHWAAKTGSDASKADWQATWRNWVRKAMEFGAKAATAQAPDDIFGGSR